MLQNAVKKLKIRPATRSDFRAIKDLIENSWAVHTRLVLPSIQENLDRYVSFLVEDENALRAFLLIEPQEPDSALLLTLAIHDNVSVVNILDRLFPMIKETLKERGVKHLLHIGQARWLISILPQYGFAVKDQIITFERKKQTLPEIIHHPNLIIRPAHLSNLQNLLALDQLVFPYTWRKSHGTFKQALAQAVSFNIGSIDGQVVAYEWCDQLGDHGHLTRLATHPNFQKQGIGAQMLHQALSDLHKNGADKITLNTQINNLASQRLYHRFGFKSTAQIVDVMLAEIQKSNE